MDPNATLAELDGMNYIDPNDDDAKERRERRSELWRSLAEWISRGGFSPEWRRYPVATREFRAWQKRMRKFQDLAR